MRRDGDCSKCRYRTTCNADRAQMCAEMYPTVKQPDEIMREDRRAEHSEEI